MNENVLVSIVCITYNHEKYISKCIDSIISQQTSFNFELIIHDDCSTDETINILKQYKNKYPTIISLILEEKNVYSQGINILDDIVIPQVKGKYIAFCEGDDYWIDNYKLQKQIDGLLLNPECWICAHAVKVVDESDTKVIDKIAPINTNGIIPIEDVIRGDGGFVGTNSLVIAIDAFKKSYDFRKIYALDYFLQIMGSIHGGMLYISDEMSAYRLFSNGSWTLNMMQDKDKYIKHFKRKIQALQKVNDETNYKYNSLIYNKILDSEYNILCLENKHKEVLKKENIGMLNVISTKDKVKLFINILFPWLIKLRDRRRIKHV